MKFVRFCLFATFLFLGAPVFASESPVLYYSENCPQCKKVIRYLWETKRDVTRKSVRFPRYRTELARYGERVTPTLVVDSKVFVGSRAIIQHFSASQ